MASDDSKTPPELEADDEERDSAEPSEPKPRAADAARPAAARDEDDAASAQDVKGEPEEDEPSDPKAAQDEDDDDDDDDDAEEARPASARGSKRESDDEDDEDDDDDDDAEEARPASARGSKRESDDEDDDEEQEAAPARRRPREATRKRAAKRRVTRGEAGALAERPRRKRTRDGVKKKKRAARTKRPATEAELNTPDRATTYMLMSVVGATLILWAFARTACNFAPPEPDRHRVAEAEVIAKEPRGAGVEYELRLRERHFDIAAKLASGSAAAAVEQAKAACGASCAPLARGTVLCQGAILSRDATTASLRVSCAQEGQRDHQRLTLAKEGTMWRVTAREATTEAEPTQPPTPPDAGAADAAPTAPAP